MISSWRFIASNNAMSRRRVERSLLFAPTWYSRRNFSAVGTISNAMSPFTWARVGLRIGFRVTRALCTVTGAAVLGGFGFLVIPYVQERAPLPSDEYATLWSDAVAIGDVDSDGGQAMTTEEFWGAVSAGKLPPLTFHDLKHPWLFGMFVNLARLTFAFYSDASGKMTMEEFQSSVHKMIDVVLEVRRQKQGSRAASPEVRAATVRELTHLVVPGVFRVLDEDKSGVLDPQEYTRGALLICAALQGAPADTPALSGLAFRIVDNDGDGKVTLPELTRWVGLALEHRTAPQDAELEPRGPWGLFGTRTLTPQQLAKKWLKEFDHNKDGVLSIDEFAFLASRLRVHELIWRMAKSFTNEHLPLAPPPPVEHGPE